MSRSSLSLFWRSWRAPFCEYAFDFAVKIFQQRRRPAIRVGDDLSTAIDVPMVVFGLPAHAVGVVHPVNASPGQIVQRQAIFDAVRPVLRAGDDPGFELDHIAAAESEF